jgi:hypothetical protein
MVKFSESEIASIGFKFSRLLFHFLILNGAKTMLLQVEFPMFLDTKKHLFYSKKTPQKKPFSCPVIVLQCTAPAPVLVVPLVVRITARRGRP